MLTLSAGSVNELFTAACTAVRTDGIQVAPRGLATREIMGAHLCLTDPTRHFLDLPPARILNPAFAVAESLWIMSGSDDPWIFTFNRALEQYADDGILRGAYGPRMRRWFGTSPGEVALAGRAAVDQLDEVRRLLLKEPSSRRAVIQLFNPNSDFRSNRDVPCTLGYRFYVRENLLHMHTTMRSQDLWLGFGYDVFAATFLQQMLANWLGVDLGEYHHHVDSLHLYERDLEAAATVPPTTGPGASHPVPALSWSRFDATLTDVIAGRPVAEPGWSQFATIMTSYRDWKAGRRLSARVGLDENCGHSGEALVRWYDHLETQAVAAVGDSR